MNTRVPSADWVTVEDLERDPHPTLARLRTVGPVVWVPALSGWMITTREDNLAAMRDDVGLTVDDPRFTTGQITGPSMLSTDGAEHARHRGRVHPGSGRAHARLAGPGHHPGHGGGHREHRETGPCAAPA